MRKRKILIFVFGAIFIAVILLAGFLRRHYAVPILMYHMVDEVLVRKQESLNVTPKAFERQMSFLKRHHYKVLPLETLVDLIKENKSIPPKTVVLTFDDGYKNNYTHAFPILKKYNLPATIFIIVNEVGRSQNDRLSWEELRQMQDSGLIKFGSHSIGAEPLININDEEELKRQIFDSKKMLEAKLGQKVALFSYPEGFFTSKIAWLVKDAGYKAAVATIPCGNFPNDDLFALKRIRVSEKASNMFIFAVEASGYYTFMKEYKKCRKKHKPKA